MDRFDLNIITYTEHYIKFYRNTIRLYLFFKSSVKHFEKLVIKYQSLLSQFNGNYEDIYKYLEGRKILLELEEEEATFFKELVKNAIYNFEQFSPFITNQILISSISSFEVFLFETIKYIFQNNKNFLKSSQKMISIEQLLNLTNIEDLNQIIIEKLWHDLSYKSFENKADYFKKQFNIDFYKSKVNMDKLITLFQIRNILIHNEGIVNNIFLSNVKNTNYKLGEKIDINENELDQFLSEFRILARYIDKIVKKKFTSA